MVQKDFLIVFLTRGLAAVVSLVISVVISRVYGPEGKGVYMYALASATLISLLYFSFHQSLITIKDRFKKCEIVSTAYTIYILASGSFAFITLVLFHELLLHVWLAISIFGLLLWSTFCQFHDNVLQYNLVFLVSKTCLLFVVLVSSGWEIEYLLWALVCANFSTPILVSLLSTFNWQLSFSKTIAKVIFANSFILHLSSISMMLINEYFAIYVGDKLGLYSLGIYDALKTIYSSLLLISVGILPYINAKAINLPRSDFKQVYLKVLLFSALLFVSLLVPINIFSAELVFLIFGETFADAVPLIGLVSFIGICIITNNLIGILWIINGHFRVATIITCILAFVFLVSLHILTPSTLEDALVLFSYFLLLLSLINFCYLSGYVFSKKYN